MKLSNLSEITQLAPERSGKLEELQWKIERSGLQQGMTGIKKLKAGRITGS